MNIVLGTAQLGEAYGAMNTRGTLTEDEAFALLDTARDLGIGVLDTAQAYGASEERIGRYLRQNPGTFEVITKTDPKASTLNELEKSVEDSKTKLGLRPKVLLHRLAQAKIPGLWGLPITGVSVVNPGEALEALAMAEVKHIQMPFNLLDWRWEKAGVLARLAERPEVTVHVRSVFLQGLLLKPSEEWPHHRDYSFPGLSIQQCLRATHQDWVSGVVLGGETPQQLKEWFKESSGDLPGLGRAPETLLDPPSWPNR